MHLWCSLFSYLSISRLLYYLKDFIPEGNEENYTCNLCEFIRITINYWRNRSPTKYPIWIHRNMLIPVRSPAQGHPFGPLCSNDVIVCLLWKPFGFIANPLKKKKNLVDEHQNAHIWGRQKNTAGMGFFDEVLWGIITSQTHTDFKTMPVNT